MTRNSAVTNRFSLVKAINNIGLTVLILGTNVKSTPWADLRTVRVVEQEKLLKCKPTDLNRKCYFAVLFPAVCLLLKN